MHGYGQVPINNIALDHNTIVTIGRDCALHEIRRMFPSVIGDNADKHWVPEALAGSPP
jgi:hypothetical protein